MRRTMRPAPSSAPHVPSAAHAFMDDTHDDSHWSPPPFVRGPSVRDLARPEHFARAVAILAARHGLAGDTSPYPTGSDVVWRVGEHVVKLGAPVFASQMDAEAAWLAHVAGRLGVATPRVVARGELSGWPYLVMTRVGGVALGDLWPTLERRERERLCEHIGAFIARLAAFEPPSFAPPWEPFAVEARRASRARREHDAARGAVDAALVASVESFLVAHGCAGDRFPDDGSRVCLHTELLGAHLLVDTTDADLPLCAAIDFADARVGPRDHDVVPLPEFVLKGERGLLRRILLARGDPASSLTEAKSAELLAHALTHRYASLPRLVAACPQPVSDARELVSLFRTTE